MNATRNQKQTTTEILVQILSTIERTKDDSEARANEMADVASNALENALRITRQLEQITRRLEAIETPYPDPDTRPRPKMLAPLTPPTRTQTQTQTQTRTPAPAQKYGKPRTGRALYAWARENTCLKEIDEIGKSRGYSGRIVSWDEDQTSNALADLREIDEEWRAHRDRDSA